ncbi:ganglioside GM2 activator-like [Diadema antillarum]|uniref:ganglioside GM2 activator-like n=1 Tax=Diadema antillarum TaxID=105358 RepID=UPI003A8844A0
MAGQSSLLLLLAAITVSFIAVDAGRSSRSTRGLSTFKAIDCGGANAAIRFNRISLTPRPIILPGIMNIDFSVNVRRNISQTITADIELSRRMDFGWLGHIWIDLISACTAGQDCSRKDLCEEMNRYVAARGCPPEATGNGINCTCPLEVGSYSTRSDLPLRYEFLESRLPHDLLLGLMTGRYRMHTSLYDGNGEKIGCLKLYFGVEHRN